MKDAIEDLRSTPYHDRLVLLKSRANVLDACIQYLTLTKLFMTVCIGHSATSLLLRTAETTRSGRLTVARSVEILLL